jgi:arylformamidase
VTRIWDISVPIGQGMPSWPTNPPVRITPVKEIDAGGSSNVTELEMNTHTGTHVDAPAHFIGGGATVDRIGLDVLVGPCVVLQDTAADALDPEVVERLLEDARRDGWLGQAGHDRILFKTRSSALWDLPDFSKDYVSLDEGGARVLLERGVRLVGVDYLSVERFGGTGEVHRLLLGGGIVAVEGLDLRDVEAGVYELACLPLKIAGADGAPCRAMLRRD